jgi:hypothetical protein
MKECQSKKSWKQKNLNDTFFLPLAVQAYDELQLLQDHLQGISYDDDVVDSLDPTWGLNIRQESSMHMSLAQWKCI